MEQWCNGEHNRAYCARGYEPLSAPQKETHDRPGEASASYTDKWGIPGTCKAVWPTGQREGPGRYLERIAIAREPDARPGSETPPLIEVDGFLLPRVRNLHSPQA